MGDEGLEAHHRGTSAALAPGDLISPGHTSNLGSRRKANHVHLTATLDAVSRGAESAIGDSPGGFYVVEPTGPIEDDPNQTDKNYPGNPGNSRRSCHPLVVTDTVTDWEEHDPEDLQAMEDDVGRLERLGVEAIDD